MEQIKVSLALLSDTENSIETYATIVQNALRYKHIGIPDTTEGIVASCDTANNIRRILDEAARSLSVKRTWTFLMPISRYMEICRNNMSDSDPIPNVQGCVHHILHGEDISFMTGHVEVLAIARKIPRIKTFPPTFIEPLKSASC